ncbi:hypothetical protein AO356_21145 [Pseudomonas fluorescens]|uniref:Uncharacterized protein n=1 Tax=Pseudomonas fluorescens TaxID=294 RepID=A0A0N9W6M4_PSEFL|nr:hypothetical protein AO356_21145 [Pseudomonas fluorescens]
MPISVRFALEGQARGLCYLGRTSDRAGNLGALGAAIASKLAPTIWNAFTCGSELAREGGLKPNLPFGNVLKPIVGASLLAKAALKPT